MKYTVPVEDPQNLLNPDELAKLSELIPSKCLCNTNILDKLVRIVIDDFGVVGWDGLWGTITKIEGGREIFVGAQILINSYYAGFGTERIKRMLDTLCHEYGHHWTLCWALDYIEDPLARRYLLPFYKSRNISRDVLHYNVDYTTYDEWLHCDKEVIAEDFKYFFTPCKDHLMESVSEIGLPGIRVNYLLSRMVHPDSV